MTQHLLMIEDDERLARMVAEYLGQSGYEVAHAPDATRAWPRCKHRRLRCLHWSSWI